MATTSHQKVAANQVLAKIQPVNQAWRRLRDCCKPLHKRASASGCSHQNDVP